MFRAPKLIAFQKHLKAALNSKFSTKKRTACKKREKEAFSHNYEKGSGLNCALHDLHTYKKNITKIIKTTKAITFSISLRFRNLSLFIHSGGLMSHLNSCYRNVPPRNTYPLYFVNTFQSFFWGIVSNCIRK